MHPRNIPEATQEEERVWTPEEVWAALRNPAPATESDAFRRGVEQLRARVERIAQRMARRGLETDDLVQEALQSTIRFSRIRPEPPENLDGFLYHRIRYVAKELLRPTRRQDPLTESQKTALVDVIVRPVEALEEEELRRAFTDCIQGLSGTSASVRDLIQAPGTDRARAARDLGIDRNALAQRLFRARREVLDCLAAKGVIEP